MKRRSFLQLLGLAPAAAALPVKAEAAFPKELIKEVSKTITLPHVADLHCTVSVSESYIFKRRDYPGD